MLTAPDKIRRAIAETLANGADIKLGPLDTIEQINNAFATLEQCDDIGVDGIEQATHEFRGTGSFQTEIDAPYSRHYESQSMATQLPDGSWVGWTYWYGGGKHGEPEAIDWICDAYDLECAETQEMVTVRKFTKKGE